MSELKNSFNAVEKLLLLSYVFRVTYFEHFTFFHNRSVHTHFYCKHHAFCGLSSHDLHMLDLHTGHNTFIHVYVLEDF